MNRFVSAYSVLSAVSPAGPAETGLGALPEWNLTDLYPAMDSPEFARDLARAADECARFAADWRGKLGEIAGGADASQKLFEAVRRYETIEDLLSTGRTLGAEEVRSDQDVAAAIEDIIHWLRTPARANRVTVTSSVEPGTSVRVRPSGLRQVLTNLIGNAIVHNVEGGTVHISVERSMDEARDHRVRVIVRDEGRGLAPDEVARVFEPFVRFAQEVVKGTGLGLSLARAVAERDGAFIGVESTLGEGSTFWVDYPAG